MTFRNGFLIFLLATFTHFANAQYSFKKIKTDWQASWLCAPPPYDTLQNTWLCWRKSFDLTEKPTTKIVANIAVDSKYWLYVNGQMVVFEGQLKRGPTPDDTYFDVVEIGKYLKKGKNTIALLHWYWGKNGFSHKSSGKAGLLFEIQSNATQQLDASLKLASSSQAWKVTHHPSFLRDSPKPHPNYRLSEYNIHFDSNSDINNWFSTDYDDSKWANAVEKGKAPCAPWGQMWERNIPQWYDSGLIKYPSVTKRLGAKQDTIIAFLPRNLTITPYFEAEANGGERIEIRTDNYFGGSAPNVRTDYIAKKGKQNFETFAFMNGHEVWYIVPKTVTLSNLKYRETRYNTEGVGYFKSNDDFLNKLWEKSRNTLDISMRDNYMDCPDRERAQWWGDAVLQVGETFYAYNRNADPLTQKAISNFVEWQKKDSVLYAPVPAGNWHNELPGQSLATVWGIKDYFDHSGDTAIMRYAYPFVKKYMDIWKMDANDLVVHREGGWMWHDWGNHVDVPVLDNVWYYRALEALEKMTELCQNTEGPLNAVFKKDLGEIKIKKEKLKAAFQKIFWNGKAFASKDYKKGADDRANGLAVVAGMIEPNQWASIKTVLDTTFYAGPYLEKYILEAYFVQNDAKGGIERMKERYAAMVKSPLTTLWEGWEVGSSTYGGGTYNHGWTGGPLTLMSQYIAGLSPNTVEYDRRNPASGGEGYQTFKIMPQPHDLTYFKMGAATQKGFATVEWKRTKNTAFLTIKTPNSNGLIGIPKVFPFSKIKMNGKIIWEKNKKSKNTEGVSFLEETTNHIILNVPKGDYKFKLCL
jgi:alpha-L-rhamnosidase